MNTVLKVSGGEVKLLDAVTAGKYRVMSDVNIFAAVRRGDRDAAVFLVFHRYGDVLLRLVELYADPECRDRLLSELVSELYCYLDRVGWEKSLPREAGKVRGYLFIVERNLLHKMRMRDFNVRGGSPTVSVEDVQDFANRQTSADVPDKRTEEKDYVERVLASLSATRRFLLCKRYMEGYMSSEVAEMLPAFWDSIGEKYPVDKPTPAYVDNIVSRTTRGIRSNQRI